MDLLEEDLDKLFYDNPFLAEIYHSTAATSSEASPHGAAATTAAEQLKMSLISPPWDGQETLIRCPSSSNAGIAAGVSAPQLISFEKEIKNINSSMNNSPKNAADRNLKIIRFSSSPLKPPLADEDDAGFAAAQQRESVLTATSSTRTPSQAQDHLLSERKRRQNLRQLFIDLSKVVPGLRRLDKATLLEDAITHLKSLQERVVALEREDGEMTSSTSAADNMRCDPYCTESPASASASGNGGSEWGPPGRPEISVRAMDMQVLIKIYCKKEMGLMSRIPFELERIHLNVIDFRIMPFGQEALDVTILAEMKREFVGTVKDIVDHMQAVLAQI